MRAGIIGLALVALAGCGQSAEETTMPAELTASQQQLLNCTAYYQLSAKTIKRMGVQRMLPVAERLDASADALQLRLGEALGAERSGPLLAQTQQQMLAALPDPNQLGPLMQQYREPCQQLALQ